MSIGAKTAENSGDVLPVRTLTRASVVHGDWHEANRKSLAGAPPAGTGHVGLVRVVHPTKYFPVPLGPSLSAGLIVELPDVTHAHTSAVTPPQLHEAPKVPNLGAG